MKRNTLLKCLIQSSQILVLLKTMCRKVTTLMWNTKGIVMSTIDVYRSIHRTYLNSLADAFICLYTCCCSCSRDILLSDKILKDERHFKYVHLHHPVMSSINCKNTKPFLYVCVCTFFKACFFSVNILCNIFIYQILCSYIS